MVGCALYGDGDWEVSPVLHLTLLDHPDHQVQPLASGASRGFTVNSTKIV